MAVRTLACSAIAGVLGLAGALAVGGAARAAPATDYQLPFPCGEEWSGSTRAYHSPSSRAVDFNSPDDLGKPVLAPASGVVTSAVDLGDRSYGRYIKVAHGNDESSLYAHLDAMYVTAGQRVDQGDVIGAVGNSGGSFGSHLHFEERRGSTVITPYFDGVAYHMPQTSRSQNCVNVPVVGDWNNVGADNLGYFQRRGRGYFVQKLGQRTVRLRLGRGIDTPLSGDFDGDGRTDIGVRRKRDGHFLLRGADGTVDQTVQMGGQADTGVSGDWNGDGTTEVGIWRPRTSDFRLRLADGTVQSVDLGSTGSLPVTGDFNGDRRTDVAVYDAATSTWSMRLRTKSAWAAASSVKAGRTYELPVTGDWNGDNITDLGTWNRATGAWTQRTVVHGTARTSVTYFGAQQ